MDKLKEIEKLVEQYPDNKLTPLILKIINPKTVDELVKTLADTAAEKAEQSAREALESEREATRTAMLNILERAAGINWEDDPYKLYEDSKQPTKPNLNMKRVKMGNETLHIPVYSDGDLE